MCPWYILMAVLCLQCGGVHNAFRMPEIVDVLAQFGESATLPCNGSAYLEEEGSFAWEVLGLDVAVLQGGELREGSKFKGRLQLPSEERLREGDWSVVLHDVRFGDSNMYECIWQGRRTISTVWLKVTEPDYSHDEIVLAGGSMELLCLIPFLRGQSVSERQVWWTRNGTTVETEAFDWPHSPSSLDYEVFRFYRKSVAMSDTGEYRCWYKNGDSADARPGIPESIAVTVVELDSLVPTVTETTTATEAWASGWTEEVTDTTETTEPPPDLVAVHLAASTQQPIDVLTESQQMEAFEETVTAIPGEGAMEASPSSPESLQWDSLPWIRIGLIAGVLFVTAVVLCILGALRKI